MSTLVASHPIKPSLTAEALSLLLGIGITFTLFFSVAHSSGEAEQPKPVEIEDLRAISIPPDPPPPAPEVVPTENVAPMEFAGLEVAASDSPVKIEVSPMEFDHMLTTVAPPANITVNQVYHEFKPGMDYAESSQRVYQKSEVDTTVVRLRQEVLPIPYWVRKKASAMAITLIFIVERDGTVTNVRVAKTSGNKDFDDIIVRSLLEEWAFAPAIRRGKTVRCMTQQLFIFKWEAGSVFGP